MGLGPSLTLEATFNPDFGQVEADPAEVNLTAFATRFPERRPFFTEGSRLLTTPNQSKFFYSRRIGARPVGPAPGDYVDYPDTATILAAGKITGRLHSRTSIGVLGAVTSDESARIAHASGAPVNQDPASGRLCTYGVGRVQQEFGQLGSTVSAQVAMLHRNVTRRRSARRPAGTQRAHLRSRHAAALQGRRIRARVGRPRHSRQRRSCKAIEGHPAGTRALHAAARQGLRPLDPRGTSLTGYSQTMSFNRISGRHWLFGVSSIYDSVAFEANQIGQMNGADGIQPNFNLTYRETLPGRHVSKLLDSAEPAERMEPRLEPSDRHRRLRRST